MNIYRIVALIAVACTMCGCSKEDLTSLFNAPAENVIHIGGIDTDEMIVSANTRAAGVAAETVNWLVQPLKNGLDITYGLSDATDKHQDVAILKLEDSDGVGGNPYDTEHGLAVYSFKYRADRTSDPDVDAENNAIWYNNGYHYFQGVHVPGRIRYSTNVSEVEGKAPALTTDQHDATDTGDDAQLGNYTLLSHYLGMPANYRLTATVERIKLPFRHRLARVVAFVLIDPVLGTTLKGYKKDASGNVVTEEDPTTTSIRFCNVKVLQGVKDTPESADANAHHNLTPTWTEARKVIPHFDGERGSYSYKTLQELDGNGDFKFYYKEEDSRIVDEVYPTSANWKSIHDATPVDGLHKGYVEVNYGKVPVYDVIVRPTYSTIGDVSAENNVMYDEENYATQKQTLANQTNKIDFEIELENGLRYEKRFEFDLNANYQTVVYLRISREHVDYNDAGSDIWIETKTYDDWYGVDNENGNTLSFAGSSWQRAYTYGAKVGERKPTDPHNSETKDGNDAQGVTDGKFYNSDTTPEENEHAQYFTTDPDHTAMWIKRFLQAYQGGEHHGDYFILRSNITIDSRLIPENFVFTGHLDGQDHTITLNHVDEPVYKDAENIEGLYTKSVGAYTSWSIPTLYVKHVTPAEYYQAGELTEVGGRTYVTSTLTHHPDVKYTQAEVDEENAKHLVTDANRVEPGGDGYNPTYEPEYTPITPDDVKTLAHYEVTGGSVEATAEVTIKTPEVITYPVAAAGTTPAYPTTLEQLKTNEYYTDDHSGTRFTCPVLYQFSHNSSAYLFAGLNGTYTTAQEANPSISADKWEANVHQETNKTTVWVPTLGYRAEVINTKVASTATLFKDGAIITGNVQNCWNGSEPIDNHTPAIPQYK